MKLDYTYKTLNIGVMQKIFEKYDAPFFHFNEYKNTILKDLGIKINFEEVNQHKLIMTIKQIAKYYNSLLFLARNVDPDHNGEFGAIELNHTRFKIKFVDKTSLMFPYPKTNDLGKLLKALTSINDKVNSKEFSNQLPGNALEHNADAPSRAPNAAAAPTAKPVGEMSAFVKKLIEHSKSMKP
jgi:hypothetical protein